MSSALPQAFGAYNGLSVPVIVTDAAYGIVYLNPRAEAYWRTEAAAVRGRRVDQALLLVPPEGHEMLAWLNAVLYPAFVTGDPFVCETTAGGMRRIVRFAGTRLSHGDQWYHVLTLEPEVERRATVKTPTWALRDPLTGLFNRHQWQRELAERDAEGGTVVFFDLDDLKAINDLAGHDCGDQALVTVAKAIEASAPAGALVIRFGGDEFLAALGPDAGDQAVPFAERAVAAAAAAGAAQRFPLPLRMGYGIAPFGPGELEASIAVADENLYARKGVLLRGSLGGRIILQGRTGGPRLMTPGGAAAGPAPGAFASGFGPEFEGYFRQMFARATEQAREFVDFVQPEAGAAVVEVGAGTGRISFDGGLAERIGHQGQLLMTDASEAQLHVARQRAEALELSWVRFLVAPVEDLPLASGTVDLVLGSTFLHFTDAPAAIRSMARITRPGGRVAISALLPPQWGPAWDFALEPAVSLLASHGLPFRGLGIPQDELEGLFTASGLRIETATVSGDERVQFPTAELAIGVIRQGRLVPLFLRGIPESEQQGLQEIVEARFRSAVSQMGPRSGDASTPMISLVASKPG